MKNCLYFICPTDGLETLIEETFQEENYFFSSLGNSIHFGKEGLRQTEELIYTKKIEEISFVLSDDNHIVLDALGKQDFSKIPGLTRFYDQVIGQKKQLTMFWQTWNSTSLLLSYFLNHKIKELENGLRGLIAEPPIIKGKLYKKKENLFDNIYSDLICQDDFCLN